MVWYRHLALDIFFKDLKTQAKEKYPKDKKPKKTQNRKKKILSCYFYTVSLSGVFLSMLLKFSFYILFFSFFVLKILLRQINTENDSSKEEDVKNYRLFSH